MMDKKTYYNNLTVSSSPHLVTSLDKSKTMMMVLFALVPSLVMCVLFPGPLPGARQENPRVDGLHMTHRRAGDAARVGEPDDLSHLRGGHGSKGARGRRPGEGGAPNIYIF